MRIARKCGEDPTFEPSSVDEALRHLAVSRQATKAANDKAVVVTNVVQRLKGVCDDVDASKLSGRRASRRNRARRETARQPQGGTEEEAALCRLNVPNADTQRPALWLSSSWDGDRLFCWECTAERLMLDYLQDIELAVKLGDLKERKRSNGQS